MGVLDGLLGSTNSYVQTGDGGYGNFLKDAVNLGTGLLTNYLTKKAGSGVKSTIKGKGKQDRQAAEEVQSAFVNTGLLASQAEKAKLSILGSLGAEGTYGPKDDIYGPNSPFTKMGSMQIFDPDKARGLFGTPTTIPTTPTTPAGQTYYGHIPKNYKYKIGGDAASMVQAMQFFPYGVYPDSQVSGKQGIRFSKLQKNVKDQLSKAVTDGKLSQNLYDVIISGGRDSAAFDKLTAEEKEQFMTGITQLSVQNYGAMANQALGMEGFNSGMNGIYFNQPQFGIPGQTNKSLAFYQAALDAAVAKGDTASANAIRRAMAAMSQQPAAPGQTTTTSGIGDDLVSPTKYAEAFLHTSLGRTASAQTAMAEQLVNQSGPLYEKIHRQITAPIYDGANQLGRESLNIIRTMIGQGGSARRAGLREAMELSNALDIRTQLSSALKESELQLLNTSHTFAQQVATFNVNLVENLPLIGRSYQNTLQRLNEFYVNNLIPTVSALRGSAFNSKMKLEQAKMRERLSNTQLLMGTLTSTISSLLEPKQSTTQFPNQVIYT